MNQKIGFNRLDIVSKATNVRKGRLKVQAQDCPTQNMCLNGFDTECSAVHPSETNSV